MTEPTNTKLELPRPLINQLLHAAQSMPDKVHWGVISAKGSLPVRCHRVEPGDNDALARLQRKLVERGETLFAWYQADPGTARTPDWLELGKLDAHVNVFLSVSLGTKGVLQLRGWRVEGQQVSELEVGLSEVP